MPRRILLTALGDLAVFLLIAGMGEVSVRLLYPQASRYVFTPAVTGGHPILYNSHGLRDGEFPAGLPAGERRILCLGDSSTFGAGLKAEETYPKQLERILHRSPEGSHWRVINAGGQGASASELTRFLEEKGLGFEPEIVTLGFSPTMVSVAGRGGTAAETGGVPPGAAQSLHMEGWRKLRRALLSVHMRLHSSYLYVLLDANLRQRLYRWGVIRDRMDTREGALFAYAFDVPGVQREEVERAYGTLRAELSRLKQLAQSHGIRLVVLGLPSRFRISGLAADNERGYDLRKIRIEPLARVEGICRELEISFVDLQARLSRERQTMQEGRARWDDLYIFGDYAHLNPAGMGIAAEELAAALTNPEDYKRSINSCYQPEHVPSGSPCLPAPVER